MELTNDFRVGVPVERAWELLTDVEGIAPCMPGAQLQEIEGDEYRGIVKVKVGPITAQYKGVARFLERDEAAHRAVLRAEGRETRGQGNANATITARLEPDGDATNVTVVTDLTITGRVAQFGRGVLADVSAKLLGQFVDCLESKLLAPTPAAAESESASASVSETATSAPSTGPRDIASEGAAASQQADRAGETMSWPAGAAAASPPASAANGAERPGVRFVESPDAEPVDLFDAAGAPLVKRLAPAAIGLTALWLLSVFLRRRRRR
ncbi:MAG TPA: SRPBCC family protein [Acidimicrobiales bacterium]|nr:SRPBCC family protein [Acidimicrobiales bacterium]